VRMLDHEFEPEVTDVHRLELITSTPEHGSGLDMAESEPGVLSSRRLDRRIPDKPTLINEIAAWGTTETSTTPKPIGRSPA
jgi:hypothetical protein